MVNLVMDQTSCKKLVMNKAVPITLPWDTMERVDLEEHGEPIEKMVKMVKMGKMEIKIVMEMEMAMV
jgi:hypothetical protein